MAAHIDRKAERPPSAGAPAVGLPNVHLASAGAGDVGTAPSRAPTSYVVTGQRKKRRSAGAHYGVAHPSHAHYAHIESQGPHASLNVGMLPRGKSRAASELPTTTSKVRSSSSSRGTRAAASSSALKAAAAMTAPSLPQSRVLSSSSVCVDRSVRFAAAATAAAGAGDSSPLAAAAARAAVLQPWFDNYVCVTASSSKRRVRPEVQNRPPVVGALRPPSAPPESLRVAKCVNTIVSHEQTRTSDAQNSGSVLLTMSGDSSPTRPVTAHTASSHSRSVSHSSLHPGVVLPPSTASSSSSLGRKRPRAVTADELPPTPRAPKIPHRVPTDAAAESNCGGSVEAPHRGKVASHQQKVNRIPMPDTLKRPHHRPLHAESSAHCSIPFCKSGTGLEVQEETILSQAGMISGQSGNGYRVNRGHPEDAENFSQTQGGHLNSNCESSRTSTASATSDASRARHAHENDGETSVANARSTDPACAAATAPAPASSSKKRSRNEYERERPSPVSTDIDEELSPCSSTAAGVNANDCDREQPPTKRAKASAAADSPTKATRHRSRPVDLRLPLAFGTDYVYENVCTKDVEHQMYAREQDYHSRVDPRCLTRHVGLHPPMRSILLDWLFEVSQQFQLSRVTAHISIYYVDAFLSLSSGFEKGLLQLVGITSLFVAAKFHALTEHCPSVIDFAAATGDNCTTDAILTMEKRFLDVLNWELMPIPAVQWVSYYFQSAVLGAERRIADIDRELAHPPLSDDDADAPPPYVSSSSSCDGDIIDTPMKSPPPAEAGGRTQRDESNKFSHMSSVSVSNTPADVQGNVSSHDDDSHDEKFVKVCVSSPMKDTAMNTSTTTHCHDVSSSASSSSFSDSMLLSSSVTVLDESSCHSQDSAFSQNTQLEDSQDDTECDKNDSQETLLEEDFSASPPRMSHAQDSRATSGSSSSATIFSSPISVLSTSSAETTTVRRPFGDVTELYSSPTKSSASVGQDSVEASQRRRRYRQEHQQHVAALEEERQELALLVADLRQPALFVRVMELLDLSSLDLRMLDFLPSDLAMCACYLVFGNRIAFSFELFSDGRLSESRDTIIERLSDAIRFVKNFSLVPYFGVVRLTEPYLETVPAEERQHEIQMFNPDALELLFRRGVLDRESRTPQQRPRRGGGGRRARRPLQAM